ncbi:MAG: ATP-binding protein [Actinomycetota bacterium]
MPSVWEKLALDRRTLDLLQRSARRPGDSYLFLGPRGVPKEAAARAFATAAVCAEACGAGGACGECSCCSRALRGIHPDVAWFSPEGFTYPVELVREMAASASQTPMEAPRRVMIVEEADRMAERSQNALLKALEEPHARLTWVLVADSLELFSPTIPSRCQIVEFAPVPEETVRAQLAGLARISPPGEVDRIVRAARGNLEQALALAGDEQARSLRALAIDAATTDGPTTAWALATAERALGLARAAREAKQAELEAESTARGGASARAAERHRRVLRRVETEVLVDFLGWLAGAFRDLAAISSGADPSAITSPDRTDDLGRAATGRPAAFGLEMIDACLAAQLALRQNAEPGMVVESVLLALCV